MSAYRHATVRGPNGTGAGKRPSLTPLSQVDRLIGTSAKTSCSLIRRHSLKDSFCMSVPFIGQLTPNYSHEFDRLKEVILGIFPLSSCVTFRKIFCLILTFLPRCGDPFERNQDPHSGMYPAETSLRKPSRNFSL